MQTLAMARNAILKPLWMRWVCYAGPSRHFWGSRIRIYRMRCIDHHLLRDL